MTVLVPAELRGIAVDLVTHDAAKFFRLLLRRNGYVLEQLLSPLVVHRTAAHAELIALAPACLTRHHAHHYLGFARTQWGLFERTGELKPLLYTVRVLLTGIHLLRTGEVVADLPTLAARLDEAPPYLGELVAAKASGEHRAMSTVPGAPTPAHLAADVERLVGHLETARDASALPERPSAEAALHDLLLRLRLG